MAKLAEYVAYIVEAIDGPVFMAGGSLSEGRERSQSPTKSSSVSPSKSRKPSSPGEQYFINEVKE